MCLHEIEVFSKTTDDHTLHGQQLLRQLGSRGVAVKLKRCSFLVVEIDYVGDVIQQNILEITDIATSAIKRLKAAAS